MMSIETQKNLSSDGAGEMNGMRVRIAPSPTGFLHVGTARTALFNFLFARKTGGTFIVRIEDTDLERSNPEFETEILESLQWLGLDWDEGPIADAQNQKSNIKYKKYVGDYGPYRQSERIATYTLHIEKLLEQGKAYWCYHSEEELEIIRNDQEARGVPQKYPGFCRDPREREKQKAKGNLGIIRFIVPSGRKIVFIDLIRGKIEFDSNLMGDFSIAKNPEAPLYNFAVVIDDYLMQITHVIRGEDHISNTPKQILLAEALGFPSPIFAHLPLILGTDRSKLSKRHGATSIREYREAGYIPEALINFMALLGWSPQAKEGGTDQEVFTIDELTRHFSIEKTQKAGAIFNIAKLDSLNSLHMRRLPLEDLTRRAIPFFVSAGVLAQKDAAIRIAGTGEEISFDWLMKVIALEKERVKKLADFPEATAFLFLKTVSFPKELLRWKQMTDDEVRASLEKVELALSEIPEREWAQTIIAQKIKDIAQGDNGRYFWPMRVALSGREKSPGPQEIAEVLGKTKTLARIEDAKTLLG